MVLGLMKGKMTIADVKFLGHLIGNGHPCFIIGEAGLNHNGNGITAKKLIDVAASSGCDAVKFQKRNVKELAISSVLDAKDDRFPMFGSTYRKIREYLEFDRKQYIELINHAKQRRIKFLCTAFDIESVDFLESLGIEAYKLASHSLTNLPLLEYVAKIGKPTILSTGMATLEEVDVAVNILKTKGVPLILLHCVSSYPQAVEESNLLLIDRYREHYQIPIGYSGHEIGWIPTLAAVARGARVIERHITLDNKMVGFDHKLSLMPEELSQMVKDIRDIEKALGTSEKRVSKREMITRNKYHVSWVSKVDIRKGQAIAEEMLALKNPGTGIPAHKKNMIIGKRAKIDIPADTLLDATTVDI